MISITKKYLTWQRPLWKKSNKVEKHLDLPLNTVVTAIDENIENGLQLIEYGKYRGWVELDYLEPYVEQLEKDCVDLSDLQTPSDTDAQQYVIVDGKRVVNACGMISIAYVAGISLSDVIQIWKSENAGHYRIVDRGNWLTSAEDLMTILATLGRKSDRLRMKRYTPSNLGQRDIVAVTMNSNTGRLHTSGVRHWVVPVSVFPDRLGYGTIDIYNPFPNRIERYSWREFMQSAVLVSGVRVENG